MKTTIKFPKDITTNRVHSSRVALLITLLTISVMMLVTTSIGEFENESIIPPIITLATITSAIATAIIAMSLKREVYAVTESPLSVIVFDFADSKSDQIAKAAADNRWSTISDLTKESNGAAMRLEVVYSKDQRFAAYQFFIYVPHSYEACSQIFYLEREDIARVNFANLKS